MPIYTFTNTKTNKEFTEMMTIAEMGKVSKENKHIKQNISGIRIVAMLVMLVIDKIVTKRNIIKSSIFTSNECFN